MTPIKNRTLEDFENLTSQTINSFPSNWAPQGGRIYISSSDVDLKKSMDLTCTTTCVIYSSKKITLESDSVLENIRLISEDMIDMGSKIRLGKPNYCTTGDGEVFLAPKQYVKLGSDMLLYGVQIFVGRDMELQSKPKSSALAIQAGRDIIFQSNQNFTTCDRTEHVVVGGENRGRLVY